MTWSVLPRDQDSYVRSCSTHLLGMLALADILADPHMYVLRVWHDCAFEVSERTVT